MLLTKALTRGGNMTLHRFLAILSFLVASDGAFSFVGKRIVKFAHAPSNKQRIQISPIDDTKFLGETSSSALCMFRDKERPFLAIITETDACDSDEKVDETYQTIREALGTDNQDGVDLISIRVSNTQNDSNNGSEQENVRQKRIVDLATRIMALKAKISTLSKSRSEFIVVINDNVSAALESNVDGVHVKEGSVSDIGRIRKLLKEHKRNRRCKNESDTTGEVEEETQVIIGTSAHSVDTALSAWRNYKPDYFFVGTCYLTKSHPEKNSDDLEGPALPGLVRQKLLDEQEEDSNIPQVFAIGGIDDENCHEPVVNYGADGVAVIRAVMQASKPRKTVISMKEKMHHKLKNRMELP